MEVSRPTARVWVSTQSVRRILSVALRKSDVLADDVWLSVTGLPLSERAVSSVETVWSPGSEGYVTLNV